ncbi:MAG TPA: histidine kinase [Acidimicrobiales bacterium]|nr:histidine kinase [Acidimicrobiales bacterium]
MTFTGAPVRTGPDTSSAAAAVSSARERSGLLPFLSAATVVAVAGWAAVQAGPARASTNVAAAVVGCWAVAGVAVATRPRLRPLGMIALAVAAAGAAGLLGSVGTVAWTGATRSAAAVLRPVGLALVPAALFHLFLGLPDGTLASPGRRATATAGWTVASAAGLALWVDRPHLVAGVVAAESVVAVAVGAPLSNRRYRAASASDRQRLQWLGCGAALLAEAAVVLGALRLLVGWPRPLFTVLAAATIVVPLSLAGGTSARLAGRSDRLLVATVSLAGLSGVVLAIYVFIVIGLGSVPGTEDRTVVVLSMLAAALSAAAYTPARERLSVFANRLVYGAREAPDEALRTWGSRLSRAIPMDELLLQLAESLRKTMGTAAEVWTGGEGRFERVASVPDRGPATIRLSAEEEPVLCRAGVVSRGWLEVWLPALLAGRGDAQIRVVPVVNSGELLGLLVLERRPDLAPYTEEEDRTLAELARQVGLALHNMQLDTALQASLDEVRRQAEELRASRARIVVAADASRREIERNLHDGAQQHLVAMAVKMRLAATLMDSDAGAAKRMLEELRSDLQAAVQELRDLAHGIYPPLLMDRGLEAALSAAAARSALATTVVTDGVGRYPSPVEAAVYFCCLEAIQNAGKHAGDGATIMVTVAEDGDRLTFEVADDGAGFDVGARSGGHGFVNMGDRVGAIGGALDVSSEPGRGARIRGWVPVA